MGYGSSNGGRPFEMASKASHHHIINDPAVKAVLEQLWIPPEVKDTSINDFVESYEPADISAIQYIIAIDGGYSEIPIRKKFPSALLHFFQFGALLLKQEDLKKLERQPFISPRDMSVLKDIQRIKLVLPTKNVRDKNKQSLKESVRSHIYNFFLAESLGEGTSLIDTLKWFIFRQYKTGSLRAQDDSKWSLPSNPILATAPGIELRLENISSEGTFTCPTTGGTVFLTDVFRLHEIIDEETGAAGIGGYLAGVIEHMIMLHIVRILLKNDPSQLKRLIFIMDRPTGFFGQTARLHILMAELVNWLFSNHQFFLVGLEKSGAFVDHARELQQVMKAGSYLVLGDDYIYRFITPGAGNPDAPYASTSYYGHKVIFKSPSGEMYVLSVPVRRLLKNPSVSDLSNLNQILTLIESLHCDMYESAVLPVALANKLVSLSARPSSEILKAFAKKSVS